MMARFGSWAEYRCAPRQIVEEQLLDWSARLKAEADQNRENQPSS